MADAAVPEKYVDFENKVNSSYVELVKKYYEESKNEGNLTEEGEVKLTEEDEDKLHEIMIDLIKELGKIREELKQSNYFIWGSIPHFNTIMETTHFNLKDFMGIHFSEDMVKATPKFNSKRKTSARKTSKGRKSGRKTSKGRKSGRKTSKGRKSGRKTSKGRKIRN
jgi:hypothetical protein